MMDGILWQHDVIVREYKKKIKQAEEYIDKGYKDLANSCTWYAEGIAYVYIQLFGKSIADAKYIYE